MRSTHKKSNVDISNEWNEIAEFRSRQIKKHTDLSFHHVLLPYALEAASRSNTSSIVDVGCGTGFLSRELSKFSTRVIGIDPSIRSIEIAQAETSDDNSSCLIFENSSVEAYAAVHPMNSFTLAVANMTLNAVNSLDTALQAIAQLLRPGGHLVLTITHPCFWPSYWEYADAEWFDYTRETFIEAPFKISLENEQMPVTTHVHRPLGQYINTLASVGLRIDELVELEPTPAVERMYPSAWKYPRFIGARCTLERSIL